MRLTDHTDQSLRLLMYLNQKQAMATLNELARALRIPKNSLIKVASRLAKHELIETVRGRAGGLLIGKDTGKKSLKELIQRTEENFHLAECFTEADCQCPFLKACPLKKELSKATRAFLDSLGQKTLDDVTPVKAASIR